MDEPDIAQVQQRLAAIITKERREAITYAILTVLCTPVFVMLGSMLALFLLLTIVQNADCHIKAIGIYTGFNGFLGWMVVFVLRWSNPPEAPRDFDKTWLAGVGVFLFLIFLTYGTPLLEIRPTLFGILFAVLGFLVLGLTGHSYMNKPLTNDTDPGDPRAALILLVSGFVASAYGEITKGSWLWIPPDESQIHLAAWLLCKLAVEPDSAVSRQSVPQRTLRLLSRLKLIRATEYHAVITSKGLDLITPATENQYTIKE